MASKARIATKVDQGGYTRVIRKLADIDQRVATKAVQDGQKETGQTITKSAKAGVPKRTGLLRKSIGYKVKTYRASKTVIVLIGPRKGYRFQVKGKWVNPTKYAHLVEFGRKRVIAGQSRKGATKATILTDRTNFFGKEVAMVAPHPFMRSAWDGNRGRVAAIHVRHINLALRAVCKGS